MKTLKSAVPNSVKGRGPAGGQPDGSPVFSRRDFVIRVAVAGAGISIAGILPFSPASIHATSTGDSMVLDGKIRFGHRIPTLARCEMLEIYSIHCMARKGHVRMDLDFRFVDNRLDGGAAFRVRLLATDGTVLAEREQIEMRDRQLVAQRRASLPANPADRPNRRGKVEFRFTELVPDRNIGEFTIEIYPVE